MAARPKNTWVSQIFNFFPDNGLPFGFVDVVYNKDGSIAGYEAEGKFYKVGQGAKKSTKEQKATDPKKFGGDFAAAVAAKNKEMDEQRELNLKAAENAADEKTRQELRAIVNNKQDYIENLRNSLPNFEAVIERYATKIARGDKLDKLEQDELKDAQNKYTSVMNTIKEVQQDIFETINPKQKKVSAGKTPLASVGPTGTPAATKVTTDTAKTSVTPSAQTPAVTGATTGSTGAGAATGKKTPSSAGAVPSSFNVGRFRQADEASMAAAEGITPGATGTKTVTPLDTLLGRVENYFDLPDYIFRLDDDLGKLLVRAVNEKWTTDRWDKEIELTNWWKRNEKSVRARLVSYGNYEDLRSNGQDVSKSDYGLWLRNKKGQLKADAQAIANYTLSDQQAEEIAKKIYLGFLDNDENAIRAFLVPFIGKTTSIVGGKTFTGYGGQALKDYQTLQAIAKANGFSLAQILPGISATATGGDLEEAVLEKIALGELDVNRISQDARNLAAIGQPEFVRGLLNQGYDLDQIYSPYKQAMASTLELNPEQIDLNDPTLRSAITDKGETNLYDFQRALRKDSRWQYTENARREVGDATLNVLRDFGFQG